MYTCMYTFSHSESFLPSAVPHLPFTTQASHTSGRDLHSTDHTPFSTILSRRVEDFQREESHDTMVRINGEDQVTVM